MKKHLLYICSKKMPERQIEIIVFGMQALMRWEIPGTEVSRLSFVSIQTLALGLYSRKLEWKIIYLSSLHLPNINPTTKDTQRGREEREDKRYSINCTLCIFCYKMCQLKWNKPVKTKWPITKNYRKKNSSTRFDHFD